MTRNRTAIVVVLGAAGLALVPLSGYLMLLEAWSAFDGPTVGFVGFAGNALLPICGILLAGGATALVAFIRLPGFVLRGSIFPLGAAFFLLAHLANIPGLGLAWSWRLQCSKGSAVACHAAADFYRCGSMCGRDPDLPRALELERLGNQIEAAKKHSK